VATNIGIHLFDLVLWLFGPVRGSEVVCREQRRAGGVLELERATIEWFLSVEASDLPFEVQPGGRSAFRSIRVDGEEVEFSEGSVDLHTRVYEETLAGRGFGLEDARPSVELVEKIRNAPVHG
jgi:UDP-N-acetyl-2-amino-2-deoxyglucuronate dehydrogenase